MERNRTGEGLAFGIAGVEKHGATCPVWHTKPRLLSMACSFLREDIAQALLVLGGKCPANCSGIVLDLRRALGPDDCRRNARPLEYPPYREFRGRLAISRRDFS